MNIICKNISVQCTAVVPAVAQEPANTGKHELTVTGTVRDRETRKKLENVTVALAGTSIDTVTNAEGVFSLKILRQGTVPQLELSHIGYQNIRFSATAPDDIADLEATIWMAPSARQLDEVVIYGDEARRIMEEALKKIPTNNPYAESMMSAFYRETVQKGKRYIGISEAMMDVYKRSPTPNAPLTATRCSLPRHAAC